MKKRFCPACGSSDKSFVQHLCIDCFTAKHRLIDFSAEIPVSVCPDCQKVLLFGVRVPSSEDALRAFVARKIKTKKLDAPVFDLHVKPMEKGGMRVLGTVSGKVDGQKISVPVLVVLKLKSALCHDCSRLRADYYEAKVQFRFETNNKKNWVVIVTEFEKRIGALFENDSLARVTKKAELKNGLDVWVGSKRAAKTVVTELARKYGVKPVASATLAGMDKNGKPVKRFTFLLRFGLQSF